jgi:hypothetical protein
MQNDETIVVAALAAKTIWLDYALEVRESGYRQRGREG